MEAIGVSNSKSWLLRSPLRMARAPLRAQYSASSPSPMGSTVMPLIAETWSRIIWTRSSSLKRYFFAGFVETATMTSSKSEAARMKTSRWPLWTGSKDPGHTTRVM